jgi:hypothetical protein
MSPDDIASVLFHVQAGLAIIEREKHLTAPDLAVKTTLSMLYKELQSKLAIADQLPNWSEPQCARLSFQMAN